MDNVAVARRLGSAAQAASHPTAQAASHPTAQEASHPTAQDVSRPDASARLVPLAFLRSGEAAIVSKVRGGGDLHHHLETLGFVGGARVKVACVAAGDLIVEVKGTQVALNRQVASRIVTTSPS